MYPLAAGLYAPRNRWYVAARSSDVARAPLERFILNRPVVFYRTEAGAPVALAGRCPHRGYPLGKGRVEGDAVICGYHGLRFEADGQCSHIPSQSIVPPKCRLKAYPLVELWDWMWIWPGDPELADRALLPDHQALALTDPAWIKRPPAYWHVEGRYQLLNDNLLDLTHLTVLHADTIGGGDVAATEARYEAGPDWVRSVRWIANASVTDWVRRSRGIEGAVDREIMLTVAAPGFHHGHDRYYPAGSDPATAATLTSCHYFASSAVDPATYELSRKNPSDPASAMKIFAEDVDAIAEIERLLGAAGEFDEIWLRADVHALRGRRMVEEMILAEGLPHGERELGAAKPGTARADRYDRQAN
jgi:phenylpropionate dioxygenase-like ring-hydroxylating dioxygenase large terminal subunit